MRFIKPFSLILAGGLRVLSAQTGGGEPLWIQYMQEPSPNYYKVRDAFYAYWGDSIPERSHGYKVFKRWEWRVTQKMKPDGTVVWPDQLSDFLSSGSVMNSGSNQYGLTGGNTGAAPCPQQGRWSPVGPVNHPYNQTSQPTGIGRVAGIAFHPTDSNTFFACAPQGGVWKTTNNGQNWKQLFGKGPAVATIGVTSMLLSYNNPDTMYIGTGDRDAADAPGYGVLASWDGGKTWVSRNSGMGNRRVGRMIMHPTNSAIMLASTENGIYRTTNGGSSWTQTLAGSSWDLAYKPTDPSIVYAIIGATFYRSTDGGQNWTLITSGLPTTGIQRAMLAVTKDDASYVYVVISNTGSGFYGLYRSVNSGVDFSSRSTSPNILGYSETGGQAGGQAWYDLDIAANPYNKEEIFVFGINVWRSSNGGTNWTINGHWVGYGNADDIHADQHSAEYNITGRKLYCGNDGGIYYTANAGVRWNNISSGIQNSQIYRLSQAQTDPFAGAQGYQDNGSSQTQQDEFFTYYGGDGMDCQTDPGDHSYMYGSYVYGRIYRAIDKTATRTLGANGTNGINEGGGWLTPFILQEGNPARMFAGYVNVWRCDNVKTSGTITWTRITTGFAGNVRRLENSPANNDILYVINGSGLLQRSNDASAGTPTWTNISGTQPSGIRYVEAHHKYPNTVYSCNATNLYRSTNQGASWTSIAVLPANSGSMNCLFIDSSCKTERLYIGSEKGVFVWDSASNTVHTFNTNFPVWADVTDLDIYYSPKGPAYSKIVASTYGMGVWRSNLFEDGTMSPKAGFYAFDSVFAVGGKLRLYENVQYGASTVKWKITPYNYSYTETTDSTSLNPVIQFSGAGLFTVQMIATNCQGSDTFTKKFWIKVFPKPASAFCKNTTNFQTVNYVIGIMRVTLSDNFSESGTYFDDGEYFDRSGEKVFRLKPNTAYTAVVKTGTYNNEYVRLYFDYNNNGKFEAFAGEVSSMPGTIMGTRNMNFTTPANLKPNIGLRMRVLSDFNALDTNACPNLGYGQGEDYTIVYDKPEPLYKASVLTACTNENLVFTDTSSGLIAQYEWDFGTGAIPLTATGKGPHTVKYTSSGYKNVRLRINGNDSLRKNNYIRIDEPPQPYLVVKSGNISGCEGRNITLAARSSNAIPFTVQWQKNGVDISGKTDTLLSLAGVTTAEAGSYTARLVNNGCSVTSAAVVLVVNPKPAVDFSINNITQCFRYHRYDFTNASTVSSGSISSNSWNLGDGNTASSVNVSHKYGNTGSYNIKLKVVSNAGCSDSVTKTVTLNPNAVLNFTVNDTDQCFNGNNFVFSNSSNISSGSISYTWHFGDGGVSVSASPSKSYTAYGLYNVRLLSVSDKSCNDTISKLMRVYSQPQAQFAISNASQCLKGNSTSFSNFTTNADGVPVYLWNFGDGNTSSTTSPVYKFSNSGTYNVKLLAVSVFGCRDSITKTTVIHPQAVPGFSVNDSDQCLSGNQFVFSNNSSIISGTITYNWNFGDNSSSSQVSPTKNYAFPGIYNIRLICTSNAGCKDTIEKPVRVYARPGVDFSIDNNLQCLKGNVFQFTNNTTVSDAAFSSRWEFRDGNISTQKDPLYSYGISGNYNVKLVVTSAFGCRDSVENPLTVLPRADVRFSVNDSDQCFAGNQFVFTNQTTLSNGSVNSLKWVFGDGQTAVVNNVNHSYNGFGIYNVSLSVLSNNQCRDTLMKAVRVYAQPKATFSVSPDLERCFNGNRFDVLSTSTIGEGNMFITWKFGDGNQVSGNSSSHQYGSHGNYVIRMLANSDYGCTDSTSQNVVVHPSPEAAFSASKTLICEKEIMSLTNQTSVASGALSHAWEFGQGNISTQVDAQTSYTAFGTYEVVLVATSEKGCKDTAKATITVAALPVPSFTIQPPQGCAGQTRFVFNATSTTPDNNPMLHQWRFGDNSGDTGKSTAHTYGAAGTYSIQLTSINAVCRDSVQQNLTVSPRVSAAFASYALDRETMRFVALDTLIPGYFYNWDFGDGVGGTGRNATHRFPENDTFLPRLIVSNSIGCADTSEGVAGINSPNYKPQDNKLNFYAYPNPVTGAFTYKFELGSTRSVKVELYDILGQKPLYTRIWDKLEPGVYYESVDMEALGLSSGTYPLRISSDDDILVVKIIYTD